MWYDTDTSSHYTTLNREWMRKRLPRVRLGVSGKGGGGEGDERSEKGSDWSERNAVYSPHPPPPTLKSQIFSLQTPKD